MTKNYIPTINISSLIKDDFKTRNTLKIIKKTDATRNSIRKHIPFVLVVIVLSLIIIALVNPQMVSIGFEKGIILVLVLDGSESMAATAYTPTCLVAAKSVVTALVTQISVKNNIGVVLFETGSGP